MEERTVKGIILAVAPQGEYGRRISLLSDQLGRVTVFASGAAKMKSHIIGATRPFTMAEFDLAKGRGAWNLHAVRVMDAFDEISMDPDISFYGSYILELGTWFSSEGMEETDAKALLNLLYVSLSALRRKVLPTELIRRLLELRLLKLQGEYTLTPPGPARTEDKPGAEEQRIRMKEDITGRLWTHALQSSLTGLYDPERIKLLCGQTIAYRGEEAAGEALLQTVGTASSCWHPFAEQVDRLFRRQIGHEFRSWQFLGFSL